MAFRTHQVLTSLSITPLESLVEKRIKGSVMRDQNWFFCSRKTLVSSCSRATSASTTRSALVLCHITQDSLICSKYATFHHLPSKIISTGHTFKPDFLFLLLCNLLHLLCELPVYCVFTAQQMKMLPCSRKAEEQWAISQYGHWSRDFTPQRIMWESYHAVQSQRFN